MSNTISFQICLYVNFYLFLKFTCKITETFSIKCSNYDVFL